MRLEQQKSKLCIDLEGDLSAYLDGELDTIDAEKVTSHLDGCAKCQGYVEQMRQMARLHRSCFTPEDIFANIDPASMFKNITSELIDEKIKKVAELFYQIGKAYLLKGFAKKNRKNKVRHNIRVRQRPVELDKAKMKTGRLFREMTDLAASSDTSKRNLTRAKSFFSTTRRERNDYLKIGRRFIEESLALDPKKEESRLYLAAYFSIGSSNYEAAKEQYRKLINMAGVSELNRTESLINIGCLYSIEYRYGEALTCFREVLKSGVIKKYPRFYRCLIFLAITHAKMGEFDQSISFFDRTVKSYPKQVDSIRDEIRGMKSFQTVVDSHDGFRRDLESRVPALFAS